jgi:PBP1b-binding outer membrane lipoprotein LpoB
MNAIARTLASVSLVSLGALALAACGSDKEYVRGSQDPSIDNPALSTGLDKDDIQRALNILLNKMRVSRVMDRWRVQDRGEATVAVAPFNNETSEHIDPMLDAMLAETEHWLVNAGTVHVISHERQLQMIRETEGTQHPIFNSATIPKYGRQMGVRYFITGKVGGADERTEDVHRVQYLLYMQVIETETSELVFDEKAEITKMVR